jgi:hypothetical protein
MDNPNTPTQTEPNLLVKQNLLVTHQTRIAYREFYKMMNLLLNDRYDGSGSNDGIKVLLFKDNIPDGVQILQNDNNILHVWNGIMRCYFYYDPTTYSYRISGSTVYTYDFIFIDEHIESNRQILEIVQNMYINKYLDNRNLEDYLKQLVRKFNYLTADDDKKTIYSNITEIAAIIADTYNGKNSEFDNSDDLNITIDDAANKAAGEILDDIMNDLYEMYKIEE